MTSPAPRDPAIDAVLTAETILGQFKTLLPRLTSMLPADVSEAVGEAQSLYPELWSALDRARSLLRTRGVDIAAYDEARARQPASMLGVNVKIRERSDAVEVASTVAFLLGGVSGAVIAGALEVAGSVGAKQGEANRSGLRDARVALDALYAAMPEVEWHKVRTHEAREAATALDALSAARTRKLLIGFVALVVVGFLGFALVKVLQSAPTEEEVVEKEREEYRELNAVLKETPCDAKSAERRVSLFQLHKQAKGRELAKKFLEQCGDNAYMRLVVGP